MRTIILVLTGMLVFANTKTVLASDCSATQPTNLTQASVAKQDVRLLWDTVLSCVEYDIQIKSLNGSVIGNYKDEDSGGKIILPNSSLGWAKDLKFRVRGIDDDNNKSRWSTFAYMTTDGYPVTKTGIQMELRKVSANSDFGNLKISWDNIPDLDRVDSYEVRVQFHGQRRKDLSYDSGTTEIGIKRDYTRSGRFNIEPMINRKRSFIKIKNVPLDNFDQYFKEPDDFEDGFPYAHLSVTVDIRTIYDGVYETTHRAGKQKRSDETSASSIIDDKTIIRTN